MIENVLYVVRNDVSGGGDGTRYGDTAFFHSETDAVELAKSTAPYYGMVYRRTLHIFEGVDEYREYRELVRQYVADELVWGYRKNWEDKYDHGYVDNRDAPVDDPEWPEYLRLKARFSTGR